MADIVDWGTDAVAACIPRYAQSRPTTIDHIDVHVRRKGLAVD